MAAPSSLCDDGGAFFVFLTVFFLLPPLLPCGAGGTFSLLRVASGRRADGRDDAVTPWRSERREDDEELRSESVDILPGDALGAVQQDELDALKRLPGKKHAKNRAVN